MKNLNKTIHKIKDEELKASEIRYRRFFETTRDGVLLLDFNSGIILDVNPFLVNLLGYSKADFLRKHLWEIGAFKDITASKENFTILQKKKYVRFEDLPLKTKTGKLIDVEFVANTHQEDDTTIIQCIIRDITEHKQTEKDLQDARIASQNVLDDLQLEKDKLAEAKAKDEAILTSIGDGMIATSKDGNIIAMNHKAEEVLGGDAKDFLGKQLYKVLCTYDDKDTVVPFEKLPIQIALATGKTTTTTTYYYKKKDGTKFPVAITVAPIMLNENLVGAVEIFRDITREREIDRAKTEFVSLTSHELRTPLTAIDGLISMVLAGEYGPVGENLKQPLEDVETSSKRLIRLVNDLLNLARIQAGRLKYELSNFSISDKILQIIPLLQPVAQEKRLELKTTKLDNVTVEGDPDKVEEIFDNLIGNAIKFTDRGNISVSTKVVDDKVELYIADTGIGIVKQDQEKLFGLFQQLQSSQGRPVGTGLGLHISRELVRKMGGDLWLEKSEPGIGSTFAFSLPLAKSQLATKVKEEVEEEAKVESDSTKETPGQKGS